MRENEVSGHIVDAAYQVHTSVGPGLLESVYERIMAHELQSRGFGVKRQVPISFSYHGIRFDEGFKADLVLEDLVIVELKSVETIAPVHKKQLLTYLRLSHKRLGLLINFGAELMKDGITRIANNLR